MAHCIARPAARRARLIMAMRAACKRVAAPSARGYEMPLKRHFRDSSNFWPMAGLFLHAERRSATKTPARASSVRAEARRLVGRSICMRALPKGRNARQGARSVTPLPSPSQYNHQQRRMARRAIAMILRLVVRADLLPKGKSARPDLGRV